MMAGTNKNLSTPRGSQLKIQRVSIDHPRRWLTAGVDDFRRTAPISVIYGLVWVVLSLAITITAYLMGLWHWLPALLGGFMFVGPLVAVGCYGISQHLSQGRKPTLGDAFTAWTAHTGQLAMIGLMLLLFFVAWFNLSMMLFALFFGLSAPSPEALLIAFFTTAEGYGMMLTGTVLGGSLAFGAFTISVVAIPTLMDRDLTFMEGIEASVKSVANNFRVMLLWAAILTGCTIIGFVTFYLGLAVILPILGYASWHAYEDLVGGDTSGNVDADLGH